MNRLWTVIVRSQSGERTCEQFSGDIRVKKMISDYADSNPGKTIEAATTGLHETHIVDKGNH